MNTDQLYAPQSPFTPFSAFVRLHHDFDRPAATVDEHIQGSGELFEGKRVRHEVRTGS